MRIRHIQRYLTTALVDKINAVDMSDVGSVAGRLDILRFFDRRMSPEERNVFEQRQQMRMSSYRDILHPDITGVRELDPDRRFASLQEMVERLERMEYHTIKLQGVAERVGGPTVGPKVLPSSHATVHYWCTKSLAEAVRCFFTNCVTRDGESALIEPAHVQRALFGYWRSEHNVAPIHKLSPVCAWHDVENHWLAAKSQNLAIAIADLFDLPISY